MPHAQNPVPSPPAADIQAFQTMKPVDKLTLIAEMHLQARQWKRSALRALHPDWPEVKVDQTVRELFLHGTD